MSDFSKYNQMRESGATAQQVYTTAKADQLNLASCIKMLRDIFNFSLVEAKEVMIMVDQPGTSLNEHQRNLIPGIEKAIEDHNMTEDNH